MAVERKPARRTVTFGNACGRRVERGEDVNETPPEAVEPLLGAERISGRLWEPCKGPEAFFVRTDSMSFQLAC
jgi:hypothetical protein